MLTPVFHPIIYLSKQCNLFAITMYQLKCLFSSTKTSLFCVQRFFFLLFFAMFLIIIYIHTLRLNKQPVIQIKMVDDVFNQIFSVNLAKILFSWPQIFFEYAVEIHSSNQMYIFFCRPFFGMHCFLKNACRFFNVLDFSSIYD